jgi:hypothetical protein
MTAKTKEFIFEFLDNGVTVKDFEQWVYAHKELEALQPTLYQDLILFDYTDKDARHQINEKLKPYIDKTEFDLWRTIRLLNKIIEDKIDIVLATRELRQLYYDTGERFIPTKLGIGYESVLDHIPIRDEYHLWNEDVLKEQLKMVDSYRDNIKKDAREFLRTISD